jgi:hypothetical protein
MAFISEKFSEKRQEKRGRHMIDLQESEIYSYRKKSRVAVYRAVYLPGLFNGLCTMVITGGTGP